MQVKLRWITCNLFSSSSACCWLFCSADSSFWPRSSCSVNRFRASELTAFSSDDICCCTSVRSLTLASSSTTRRFRLLHLWTTAIQQQQLHHSDTTRRFRLLHVWTTAIQQLQLHHSDTIIQNSYCSAAVAQLLRWRTCTQRACVQLPLVMRHWWRQKGHLAKFAPVHQ